MNRRRRLVAVEKGRLYLVVWVVIGLLLLTIGAILMIAMGGVPALPGYEKGLAGYVLFIAGLWMLVGICLGWWARGVK